MVVAMSTANTNLFKQYMPMSASASDSKTRDSRSPGSRDGSREQKKTTLFSNGRMTVIAPSAN